MRRLLESLAYFLSGFSPRNPRKAVFGAWLGKRFADNPKYFALYLAKHRPDLELVWIGDRSVLPSIPQSLPIRFVDIRTRQAWWEVLTAGVCLVSHNLTDIGPALLTRGAWRVYLGHGVAIKHMGSRDEPIANPVLRAIRRLLRHRYSCTHYVASSPAHAEKLLIENATNNIEPAQIVSCGQPRIDFLIHAHQSSEADAVRQQMLKSIGAPSVRRVITYLPTFRDRGAQAFSFCRLAPDAAAQLEDLLGRLDAVLLEKSHLVDAERTGADGLVAARRVFGLSGAVAVDTQELLLSTDLLITDYSGCYVDFLVMNRPILHFAYDRAYYEKKDRGLYFSLDRFAGGPVVEDMPSLLRQIDVVFTAPDQCAPPQQVRHVLTEYERGNACARLAELLFPGGNAEPTAKPSSML